MSLNRVSHSAAFLRCAAALAFALLSAGIARSAPSGSIARHAALPAATADSNAAHRFVYPQVHADLQTLVVTTTADAYDPRDLAAPGTGRLSLREAFALANQLDVEVTIVLEHNAVYRLERCGLFSADLNTVNELVHTANRILTISGNGAVIFQDCDGAGVIVQEGGDQLLNLADVVIQGGRSTRVPGGGVWSSGVGPVRISNMVVLDNQVKLKGSPAAPISAGGVASNGDIIISGATFENNIADLGAGAAAAVGAIKSVKSSFHGNRGPLAGALLGGKLVAPPPPPGPPPMIGLTPDGVTLVYSTLNDNSRPQVKTSGGELTSFASAIVASGSGELCRLSAGAAHSLGFNYAGGGTGCGFGKGNADVENGRSPSLTATAGMKNVDVFQPGESSPLRDAIPAASCLPPEMMPLLPVYSGITTDQRGVSRPQKGACDIGAIEAVAGSLSRHVAHPPVSDIPVDTLWAPLPMQPNWLAGAVRVTTAADTLAEKQVSLRDAFIKANAADHDSVILLEPGTVYQLERCVPEQTARDNQTNELVQVGNHSLAVYGNGSTIVQTCEGSAVIKKYGDARLLLDGVTITGGRSVAPGGGIFSAGGGELRLERCWVTDNVSNAAGGGIAAFGSVVLLNSSISNNRTFEFGGGMAVTADVTAVNTSIFDNTAGIAVGGIGIHGGIITLLFSTVAHNTAPNIAGAQLTALGTVIADFVAPVAPPGGPPEGAGHGKGPGFPPPGNCMIDNPVTSLFGNYSSDASCGFAAAHDAARLAPNRPEQPTYLVPMAGSPLIHGISAQVCSPYRRATDALGTARFSESGCDIGAIAARASR
ncbi:MAG TPA: choice-of-anchor Q domain-containing protein [Steroidobacteraceae bacterium]